MNTFWKNCVVAISVLLAMTAAGSASAAAASDAPRVSRNTIVIAEKNLDNRFTRLWTDNQFAVLGSTRGVYLEGYGVVFTTEVNLVTAPVLGILPIAVTKDGIAQHKKTKRERIPDLKRALQQALVEMAAYKEMPAVPIAEQLVVGALLTHTPRECL